jgi:hypothetical protein
VTGERVPTAWSSQASATGAAGGGVHRSDIKLAAPAQHADYVAAADCILEAEIISSSAAGRAAGVEWAFAR